jgi:uncharacterized protein (DUF1499 family)
LIGFKTSTHLNARFLRAFLMVTRCPMLGHRRNMDCPQTAQQWHTSKLYKLGRCVVVYRNRHFQVLPTESKDNTMARYALLLLLAIAVLALALLVAGQIGLLRGKAPTDLGVKDGKLKRLSKTDNSVSSQAHLWTDDPMKDYSTIEPFKITGDGTAEMTRLITLLQAMPRTTIVQQDAGYIYAQCTTALLKFTDDIEFYLDKQAGVIQVRSASRVGRKDFHVNRARVEQIRKALGQ